jgi:ketosteroid isomerase-like protein
MKACCVITMLLAVAGCGAAENRAGRTEVSDAQVLAQLTQRRADYGDALKSNDGEAVASFWTADAKLREPGMKLDGSAAVAKYASDFFVNGKVTGLDIRPEEVFVHGDVAYEFGSYDESGSTGGKAFAVQNHYVLKWQREPNGEWRMARFVAGPIAAPAQ